MWPGMLKILKIIIKCLCNISRKNWVMMLWKAYENVMKIHWVMKMIFCLMIKFFLQVYSIIFDEFGQVCPNYPGKSANLCDILRKKSGIKLGMWLHWQVQILLLQFIIFLMFSHHWLFSSFNMESISSRSFIWLIVCVT